MACATTFDALHVATERLGEEIYQFPYTETPYEQYVTRGTFPKNKGVVMTTFTGANSEPTNSRSTNWHDLSQSGSLISGLTANSLGLCAEPFVNVPVGYDIDTYKPRRLNLSGPVICKDDLTFAHMPFKFFKQIYLPNLARVVKRELDYDFRNVMMANGTHVSITTGLPEADGGGVPGVQPVLTCPTGSLAQGDLDEIAARQLRDGYTNAGERQIELGPDGPIFPIFIGMEASKRISRSDDGYRLDTRYADMGKGAEAELLKRMGATKVVGNYRHKIILDPPRADCVGGLLTLRDTYEMVDTPSAGGGKKAQYTTAYKNAQYEAAVIPHPMAFIAEFVSPDTAGLDWNPNNYMGDWKFVTGLQNISVGAGASDVCTIDPLHKFGQHFAELMYAPHTIYPGLARVVWFLRCRNDLGVIAGCTTAT